MAELFKYQVFGLNIVSTFNLPDLVQSHFVEADLYISEGRVPEMMEDFIDKGAFYYASPGRFLFVMDTVGRYWVQGGKEIIIEKAENADEKETNLFLLGSVMGASLLQRGLTPIHGCAILKNGKATIISGKSGAGKSSLAAEFIRNGSRLIADDISIVDIKKNRPIVRRGIQHLKLWEDAMKSLDLEASTAEKVRPSLNKYSKSYADFFVPDDSELSSIVFLEVKNSKGFTIEELHGVDKFNYIRANIYRGIYIEPLGVTKNVFQTISSVLEKVNVYQVARPITPLSIKELGEFIQSNIPLI